MFLLSSSGRRESLTRKLAAVNKKNCSYEHLSPQHCYDNVRALMARITFAGRMESGRHLTGRLFAFEIKHPHGDQGSHQYPNSPIRRGGHLPLPQALHLLIREKARKITRRGQVFSLLCRDTPGHLEEYRQSTQESVFNIFQNHPPVVSFGPRLRHFTLAAIVRSYGTPR